MNKSNINNTMRVYCRYLVFFFFGQDCTLASDRSSNFSNNAFLTITKSENERFFNAYVRIGADVT
jgi:hypothetical protein